MVDDKAALCFAMREYFRLHDYAVDCAHDIDQAAAILNRNRYAVVIADLDLGGAYNLDGLKVIKMARERFPETHIIVLTAYGSAEIEKVARDYGASAFLNKPQPLAKMARIIFELVGDTRDDSASR